MSENNSDVIVGRNIDNVINIEMDIMILCNNHYNKYKYSTIDISILEFDCIGTMMVQHHEARTPGPGHKQIK